MSTEALFFKTLLFFFFRIPLKQLRNLNYLPKKFSNSIHASSQYKFQRSSSSSLLKSGLTSDCDTLVFNVEGTLLKSPTLFPYFMLVAFEAGSLLRALVLFLLYPFICLAGEKIGMKMMVMVCFLGIKKSSFRAGSAVLPKFFLEDVGMEGFEMVRRGRKKKVGVSCLPRVMTENFLREYLGVDIVVGEELKVVGGYYVGLMEENCKKDMSGLEDIIFGDDGHTTAIGINNINRHISHHLFSRCKDVYLMSEADKTSWRHLPRDKYIKPLIFHDGRLAFRPTPLSSLTVFMWVPFGFFLAIFRIIVALSLTRNISGPILSFTGLRLKFNEKPDNSASVSNRNKPKGRLYVCNHRTLLDPLYISFTLNKPVTAVTYSLSRLSELLAPIRTVRLTRDRDQDGRMMDKLLNQGDLVVCPEGTTCREPYLLRFSPLFSEMSDDIVPVAMDSHVSMFHGTTAGGLKCLDPLFFLMNPCPSYSVQFLEKVTGVSTVTSCGDGGESRFRVANHVQRELGKALGFECTNLTRKDKYLILAGNEGIVG